MHIHRSSFGTLLIPVLVPIWITACGDDVSAAGGTESDGSTSSEVTSTTGPGTTATSTSTSTDTTTTDPSASVGVSTTPESSSGSTSDDSGESSSSTGAPVLCGNGRDDEGEECDDGNAEDGDRCSSLCTIPFEVLWTQTHNGETSGIDNAGGVVIDPAGNIYVAGIVSTIATARDAWVAMYQPDGTLAWETTIDAGLGLSDRAFNLALHTSGDIIVVGNTDLDATETDAWILRLAADTQTVIWQVTRDGPSSGSSAENFDSAAAVAVDASGSIVVVGNERGIDENFNIWVQMYDADGVPGWTDSYNGAASEGDFSAGVIAEADGSFIVGGTTVEASSGGWLRRYSAAGVAGDTASISDSSASLARGSTGDLFVGGRRSTASGGQIKAARYDGTFAEVWVQETDLVRGGSFSSGIAVDAEDRVFIVGTTPVVGQQDNIWIGALTAEGAPLWSDSYNNEEASLGDFGAAAAVAPDGDLVVLGTETVLGQQSNVWIRKYRTL